MYDDDGVMVTRDSKQDGGRSALYRYAGNRNLRLLRAKLHLRRLARREKAVPGCGGET